MRKPFVFIFLGLALLALMSCNPFFRDYTYRGSAITIDSNPNSSEINVMDYGRLDRVISIKLTGLSHPNAGDLEIALQTPAGTITLVDKEGGEAHFVGGTEVYEFVELGNESGLNQLVKYDSGSGEIIIPAIYQANSTFKPGNDEIKGAWTLHIYNASGISGSLASWEVTVSVNSYN